MSDTNNKFSSTQNDIARLFSKTYIIDSIVNKDGIGQVSNTCQYENPNELTFVTLKSSNVKYNIVK